MNYMRISRVLVASGNCQRKRNMFIGRTTARYDGSSWVARFVNLRQQVKSGCSAICGREKFMSLLRKVIVVSHVIQCFLNLFTEIACSIRVSMAEIISLQFPWQR